MRGGMAAALGAALLGAPAWAQVAHPQAPAKFDSMRQLHVTTLGRVVSDQTWTGDGQRGDCPQISRHTDSTFGSGEYIVQAGFAEGEVAAASFTVHPSLFPIRIDMMEMIFATYQASQSTVTEWSILVWEGTPTSGRLVAEYSSDDVILPHLRMGPGTNGTNIQVSVDPQDPEQIYVTDTGNATFTIGYRIDGHNAPPSNACTTPPPTCCNAFPTTDTSGLASPTGNWLYGLNCGPAGCPPNGGWARFSQLNSACRPTGDWVIRVTWTPDTCPGALGGCCFSGGGCLTLSQADCATAGGAWGGPGSSCGDANSNGQPDACETGCRADYNGDGDLTVADFTSFRQAFLAGDMEADFNDDGSLTVADFTAFRSAFLQGC